MKKARKTLFELDRTLVDRRNYRPRYLCNDPCDKEGGRLRPRQSLNENYVSVTNTGWKINLR